MSVNLIYEMNKVAIIADGASSIESIYQFPDIALGKYLVAHKSNFYIAADDLKYSGPQNSWQVIWWTDDLISLNYVTVGNLIYERKIAFPHSPLIDDPTLQASLWWGLALNNTKGSAINLLVDHYWLVADGPNELWNTCEGRDKYLTL